MNNKWSEWKVNGGENEDKVEQGVEKLLMN